MALAFTAAHNPSAAQPISQPSRQHGRQLRAVIETSETMPGFRLKVLGASVALAAGAMGASRHAATKAKRRRVVACRATSTKLTTPSDLLDGVDVFIFDCDGVIWRGDSLIEGIPNVLDKLRAAGKTLFFVTNNSTKSRAGYKSKFESLGLNTVQPQEIFSSSFAAAAYFEQTKFKETGKKVFVIGEKGIGEELDLIGVPWFGAEADKDKTPNMGKGGRVEFDHDVGAVVVGFDRHINYHKLQYAQLCLNELPGCQFIATNLDRVTHLTDAQEWAGNGTMVGAIEGCTGMKPNVVGKPAPLMIDYIAEKYGISDRARICMVGDRLDTDIAFGRNNGLKTCLTLSGVTSEAELLDKVPRKTGTEGIQPDFYVDTINDFVNAARPSNTDDDELEFVPGQQVTVTAPPAMAGKKGSIIGPALGNTFAVKLESGSIFNIATDNINGGSASAPVAAAPAAAPAASYVPAAASQDEEELEFTPGQRVTLLAPPAMAGKQGTIVGPALGETFAVQLESGSIFNFATENINGGNASAPAAAAPAAAPAASYVPAAASQDEEELEFTPGQRVTLLAPPAMAGKQGTIVGPALGESFAVQLDSGSIFNIPTESINGGNASAPAAAAAPVAAVAAPASSYTPAAAQDEEELEFTPGQRITLVGPPAMAGKQGSIVGPAQNNTFAVRFDSGSIFNIATENIKEVAYA